MRRPIRPINQKEGSKIHPLEQKVFEFIRTHNLINRGDRVIVGVSGGPDSVALLNILNSIRYHLQIDKIIVAHFNHHLRPESDSEEEFVRDFSEKLGLDFFCSAADVARFSKETGLSIEEAARKCRYDFFYNLKRNLNANKIAVAHNANDRAEELILRLMRGAGPSAFSSIPLRLKTGVIRPLLGAYRNQILSYLNDKGIPYVIDASNELPLYQRNRVRHEVIPLLSEISGRDVNVLLNRLADLFSDEEDFWSEQLDKCWKLLNIHESRSLEFPDHAVLWNRNVFKNMHVALQRRLIRKAIGFLKDSLYGLFLDHVESIRRLLVGRTSGRFIKWKDVTVRVEGDYIIFQRDRHNECSDCGETMDFEEIEFPGCYEIERFGIYLIVKVLPVSCFPPKCEKDEAFMDAETVKWPLFLRLWQRGDRFCPLGMHGKSKKLHDFFIDEKIPKSLRKKVLIVADSEKICWVVGLRLDDRVKVTDRTKSVIHIKMAKL